jgi:hypothetical protein
MSIPDNATFYVIFAGLFTWWICRMLMRGNNGNGSSGGGDGGTGFDGGGGGD